MFLPLLLEVSAAMPVRSVCSVVALAAAAVSACVVRGRCRRLRRAAVAERLLSGRVRDDNAVLARDLEAFRARLERLLAEHAESAPAAPAPVGEPATAPTVCPAVHDCRIALLEGGPR